MSAGLISERVRSVCRAVRNEVRSVGDGGGGASGKSDCKGVVGPRARAKLCLSEKPFDVEDGTLEL